MRYPGPTAAEWDPPPPSLLHTCLSLHLCHLSGSPNHGAGVSGRCQASWFYWL